jgi:trehalose 6-phosphate synthase/phosphatase
VTAPRRLVVVAHRLPLTLRRSGEGWSAEPSSGGLATALGPILERSRGLWIGSPGDPPLQADARRDRLIREWSETRRFHAVALPRELGARFYDGYANQTLWPLFHEFPSRVVFDADAYAAYVEANRRFADAVLAQLRPGDLVWIHDYHFLLLPRLLREAAPEVAIGFFLHIPFPSAEILRVLPQREDLLLGLLGADLLGFQTHGHLQNLRRSLLRVLGLDSRMDRVGTGGRELRLEAFPIGIAPEEFLRPLTSRGGREQAAAEMRARFGGLRVLLAVDRLDYTKGIPERLRAYRRLLETAPELRERVVLVQVAVPSRERVPRYAALRQEVNELVGEINGDFATPAWSPVVYIRRGLPRAELAALYAAADLALVTPLRDGMNLVAKEYVACQLGGAGVLVLSEFAGAAAGMGEALLVNPYDEQGTVATIRRALAMEEPERRDRMAALGRRVLRNNVFAWGERFLGALAEAAEGRSAPGYVEPPLLPVESLAAAARAARRRLLLLDYDGTLVPFTRRPSEATPPPGLLSLLARLSGRAGDVVAIVSGRARAELDAFFVGVPGLWLAAEHGALLRSPADGTWESLRGGGSSDWKGRVLPVLDHFVDRMPGSLLEEKEYAVVWHHRMSDPESGEWLAGELVAMLDDMLADTELRVVRGNKTVEVRVAWAHKGEVAARLLEQAPDADFILGAGDDRTDEDLFEGLPASAVTVHLGRGHSRAGYRLDAPEHLVGFLHRLAPEAA